MARHRRKQLPIGWIGVGGVAAGFALLPHPQPVIELVAAPTAARVLKTAPKVVRVARHVTAADVAVTAALSKVGDPYLWGAKGPDRFDCSGLTQWAYRQAGVNLPEDTYRQVAQGVPVTGAVRAGDLVFVHFGPRGPGHVLLAISPDRVVEAPGRGMTVRVAPMPANYQARRIA